MPREATRVGLPVRGTFFCKGVDQKVDEGANLGLGEPARRVNGVDALSFDRKAGHGVFDQPFFHRVGEEKAGQEGDAEARDRGVEQRLAVVE